MKHPPGRGVRPGEDQDRTPGIRRIEKILAHVTECEGGALNTASTPTIAQQHSDSIIEQFRPIVERFGFSEWPWDYDPEEDIVRVQFEDPRRGNTVQIDRHVQDDKFRANYCRMEGEGKLCIEGKHKKLAALKATLPHWIRKHCLECRTAADEGEETVP
jgi:hypothetical protein